MDIEKKNSRERRTLRSDLNKVGNFIRSRTNTEKLGAVTLLVATGLSIFNSQNSHERDYSNIDTSEYNTDITAIQIDGDARIRETPHVADAAEGPSNVLVLTGEDDEYTFKLPSGANFKNDQNGNWYGVSVEDIKKQNPELADEIGTKDEDGTVWINGQRAKVTENIEAPYFETE